MKLGKWDKVSEIIGKDENNNKDEKEEQMRIAYNNYADELFEKKENISDSFLLSILLLFKLFLFFSILHLIITPFFHNFIQYFE